MNWAQVLLRGAVAVRLISMFANATLYLFRYNGNLGMVDMTILYILSVDWRVGNVYGRVAICSSGKDHLCASHSWCP